MKSIVEAAALIKNGRLSPVEATREMLSRIDNLDLRFNSYLSVWGDRALEKARQAEAEISAGVYRGPLHGMPLGIKDLLETASTPTTVGSKVLREWLPDRDATVVKRLEEAGAVILGKLNMTEFALDLHHPEMPIPKNPWATDRWIGASSSGTGSAVAAGLCMAGIGSDTGGSIRSPSALCGVTGIKPTFGVVSRHGVFPLAASLDTVGPMARSVEDAAIMLDAIGGFDPSDPTSVPGLKGDYQTAIGREIAGLRLGVDREYITRDVHPEVSRAVLIAVDVLGDLGAELTEVEIPTLEGGEETWETVCAVDALDAHREMFEKHRNDYGPFADLLDKGMETRAEDYSRAWSLGREFSGKLRRIFEQVDVVACPSMPTPPLPVDEKGIPEFDGIGRWYRFCVPYNFSRNPTVSVPCGFSEDGLPISLQLIGRHFDEQTIISLSNAYQRSTDWHTRYPPDIDADQQYL